jgi:hypothetical protein
MLCVYVCGVEAPCTSITSLSCRRRIRLREGRTPTLPFSGQRTGRDHHDCAGSSSLEDFGALMGTDFSCRASLRSVPLLSPNRRLFPLHLGSVSEEFVCYVIPITNQLGVTRADRAEHMCVCQQMNRSL